MGKWKAVINKDGKTELYDLETDESETKDLAAKRPAIAARLKAISEEAHTPSELFG